MRLLPSCHDVQTHLTEYLEGALPWRSRVGFRVHLLFCRVCSGMKRGLEALPGLAKVSLAPSEAAPEEALAALERLQAALRKDPPSRASG